MTSKLLLAGMVVASITAISTTTEISAGTRLAAAETPTTFYVRGSNVGYVPPDQDYAAWVNAVITDIVGVHQDAAKVDYPGSFWPFSHGYLSDPTWDVSVADGVASLSAAVAGISRTIIYGYSQGAVVASEYKGDNPGSGATYVLVANLDRPNGGLLARFSGLHIPILDFTFNEPTPATGDNTYDIARQYDGWADFPKYPLNLLATANALLGIYYLHGWYDTEISAADLNDPTKTDKQVDAETGTTYYLVHTDRLPLLMPFEGIVPDAILDALDPPLRVLVELAYDRTDYGAATAAALIPQIDPVTVTKDLVNAIITGIGIGVAESTAAASAPASVPSKTSTVKPKPSTTKAAQSRPAPSKIASASHPTDTPTTTKSLTERHSGPRTRPARVPSQQSHPERSDRLGTGKS